MENYKPLEKNLEEGMSQLGKQIRSLPHITLGDNPPKPSGQPQEVKCLPVTSVQEGLFNAKENYRINQVKKWGLVIAVLLVVGYCIYRILI